MASGYEKSDDYGGREPNAVRIALIAGGVILAAIAIYLFVY